jgi:acetyl-CoA C-acetyltransferase
MKSSSPVYIVGVARTPIGAFLGALSSVAAPRLGAAAIKAALERAKVAPEQVGEVFMGNVLSAGVGQAPARQAAIYAGIPTRRPRHDREQGVRLGLQAVIFGTKSILLGDADIVVAGGMESMSNVPYYLPTAARNGSAHGQREMIDGMIHDGLWDPYGNFHMGNAGETSARAEYKFSREAQDEFAKESFRRALAAQKEGLFAPRSSAVEVPQKKGDALLVKEDEGPPKRGKPEKFAVPQARRSTKDGTITAANASSINDGASGARAREREGREGTAQPLARIVGYGGAAQAPEWFTTAPAAAIKTTLAKRGCRSTTSISTRSTRPSRWSPWP